ncbi:hypothetical protein ITJ44_08420 [Clavibacter sp. VKM Ac-2873]|uniref:hypothetical protein n=1 Tax=Clavibacter sp. VKM Ac-2873 TaxID=2783813 RepID=UPI00188AAC99|nr:hypothetical protein [Clavibacter sp. VKM Ac-2873]MBF4618096.1 hypothetical protein [Clavibacter sp. VKM Ac-2873]
MADALIKEPTPDPNVESRLARLGLSIALIHDALRPALDHARNRSALATKSAKGSDLYQDSFENLAQRLVLLGWSPHEVDGQPRLVHSDGRLALTVSSATNVASADPRVQPRTRKKGPATARAVGAPAPQSALDLPEFRSEAGARGDAADAPLWFVLHELVDQGLNIAVAKPSGLDSSGAVVAWEERIPLPSLMDDEDFSVFPLDDGDGDAAAFDVPVTPRS